MPYAPVTALIRGLAVLEAVNRLGPAMLGEICETTKLPKPSALRALDTLRYAGYVIFESDTRRYLVAARALTLSNNYRPDQALLAAGRPVMETLRQTSGWPSDLAFYQAGKMVIADTNRQPGTLSVNRSVGARVPVMRTAIGRAYLAYCSPEKRAEIVSELIATNDADEDIAQNSDKVEALIARTRERGYAISDQENVSTIRAAAVPVMQGDEVLCAFNLITLAQAMPMKTFQSTYIPMLMEARERIEKALLATHG